jgi:hypothetical protein
MDPLQKTAKESGATHYYTGKTCKNGHTSKRFTSNGGCYECCTKAGKELYGKNRQDLQWQKERMFKAVSGRAKRTEKEFTITQEDLEWPTHCPILGIELKYGGNSTKKKQNSFSMDRVDNSKGYVKGNVRIISARANSLKSNATIEELENIIKYMKENSN